MVEKRLNNTDHNIISPPKGQKLERLVLYISWTMKPFKWNYEATELEIYCIDWVITQLRHYLEVSAFTVVTDYEVINRVLRSSVQTVYAT